MNVLFVCTGNTCRSPMAEGYAKHLSSQNALFEGFVFKSAGTSAYGGSPASEESKKAMRETGVDMNSHRSQRFSRELASWADIIFAMEERHIDDINYISPGQNYKIHTLLGFAAGKEGQVTGFDVDDPYGRDIQSYRAARDQIMNAVEKILPKLLETDL